MVQLSSTTSVILFGVALFIVGCAAGAGLMVILQTFQKSKAAEKARREAIELNNIRRTRRGGGGGDQDIDIGRLARPAPTRTRTRQQQPTIPTRPRAPLSERLNGIELVEVDLRGDERRQRRR
ncbi:hypothetical protein QBC37DRAFT_421898 [Rhypophila decipiens]|uniref:Uncharacterized protein n=1 Tax=Rhypophila decipiens TaxID=261697 RepID=A0AAN7B8K9_9PEZI|nr:hypothetical protein QBC37DRAFT_421898 [Rhypophila decipiens]